MIDGSSVLRPRALVAAAAFADSGLLIDLPTRRTSTVNLTALAVWASLDGTTSLAAVAADLAAAYAVDPATIEPDVVAVADQLLALGLVDVTSDPPVGGDAPVVGAPNAVSPCVGRDLAEVDGHRYIDLPPSTCQDGLDQQDWQDVLAVAVSDHRLGIRGDSPATDATLRRVFARHLVDDRRVAANYSVVLLGDDAVAPPASHPRSGLYEGSQWQGTVTEPIAIVETLARRLAASVAEDPPVLRLEALAVTGDLGAVLLPWHQGTIAPSIAELGDRLGWRLHPAPVWIDAAGRVVIDPPGIDLDLTALDGPAHRAPSDPRPLIAVVTPGTATVRLDQPTAVATLVPWLTLAPADDADALVDLLVDLTGRVPVLTASFDDTADVTAALLRAR